jgi:putative two-component system response regulator
VVRILCADDDRANLAYLETLLGASGYEVASAPDGQSALESAHEIVPDLVVSDVLMPRMDGFRLAMEFDRDPALREIPFIFYTASYTDEEDERLAADLRVTRFVRKPMEPAALLAIVKEVLGEGRPSADGDSSDLMERYSDRLVQKLEQKVVELERALDSAIAAMVRVVEIRDPYTAGHQERVARLAMSICQAMDVASDRVAAIRVAGLLHDIGKLCVPAEILSKPGTLSQAEFDLIKRHPEMSREILQSIEFPWPIADICGQHHERLDGSGYPLGLTTDDILLEARILAVADMVEAMSSHRPYRPAFPVEAALDVIRSESGTRLDPEVVSVCCELFEKRDYDLEADVPGGYSK